MEPFIVTCLVWLNCNFRCSLCHVAVETISRVLCNSLTSKSRFRHGQVFVRALVACTASIWASSRQFPMPMLRLRIISAVWAESALTAQWPDERTVFHAGYAVMAGTC